MMFHAVYTDNSEWDFSADSWIEAVTKAQADCEGEDVELLSLEVWN